MQSKQDDIFEISPSEHEYDKQHNMLIEFLSDKDNKFKEKLCEVDTELFDALGSTLNGLQSIFYNNNVLSKNVVLLINEVNADNYPYIKDNATMPSRYHCTDHVFNIINGIYFLMKGEFITRNDAITLALAACIHDAFIGNNIIYNPVPDNVKTNMAASIVYYSNIHTFNGRDNSPHFTLTRIMNSVCERFSSSNDKLDYKTLGSTIYNIVINSTYPYDDKPIDRLSAIFRDLDRLSPWFSQTPLSIIYGGLYMELYRPFYNSKGKSFIEFVEIQNKFMNEFTIYSPDAIADFMQIQLRFSKAVCEALASEAKAKFANVTPGILLV